MAVPGCSWRTLSAFLLLLQLVYLSLDEQVGALKDCVDGHGVSGGFVQKECLNPGRKKSV